MRLLSYLFYYRVITWTLTADGYADAWNESPASFALEARFSDIPHYIKWYSKRIKVTPLIIHDYVQFEHILTYLMYYCGTRGINRS